MPSDSGSGLVASKSIDWSRTHQFCRTGGVNWDIFNFEPQHEGAWRVGDPINVVASSTQGGLRNPPGKVVVVTPQGKVHHNPCSHGHFRLRKPGLYIFTVKIKGRRKKHWPSIRLRVLPKKK